MGIAAAGELRGEASQAVSVKTCPNCGQATRDDDRFCPSCGQPTDPRRQSLPPVGTTARAARPAAAAAASNVAVYTNALRAILVGARHRARRRALRRLVGAVTRSACSRPGLEEKDRSATRRSPGSSSRARSNPHYPGQGDHGHPARDGRG